MTPHEFASKLEQLAHAAWLTGKHLCLQTADGLDLFSHARVVPRGVEVFYWAELSSYDGRTVVCSHEVARARADETGFRAVDERGSAFLGHVGAL